MIVPRRHPRIVVWSNENYPQGGHGSSARADIHLLQIWVENGGNQKANFVHNDSEGIEKDIVRIVRIIIEE